MSWQRRLRSRLQSIRWKRVVITSLVAIAILSVTSVFELYDNDRLSFGIACASDNEAVASSKVGLGELLYGPLMTFRFHPPPPHNVALITITPPSEPLSVVSNVCQGRLFMVDLVQQLAKQQPTVIVIDKFYTDGACVEPATNDLFRTTLNDPSIPPVVVGQASGMVDDSEEGQTTVKDRDCLFLKTPFDFTPATVSGRPTSAVPASNVHFGLTKLNQDNRKIPLQWWALNSQELQQHRITAATPTPGIALAAAKLADPRLTENSDLKWYIDHNEHPFGSISRKLPTWTAMQVLCHGDGSALVSQHQWGDCGGVTDKPLYLHGKVVVIGQLTSDDLQPFAGRSIYGAQLQANYIESLLEGRFVRTLPFWWDLAMAIAAVVWELFLEFTLVSEFSWFQSEWWNLLWYILGLVVLITISFSLFQAGYFTPVFLVSCTFFLTNAFARFLWLCRDGIYKAHTRFPA